MKNSALFVLLPAAIISSSAFADTPATPASTQTMIDQAATPVLMGSDAHTATSSAPVAATPEKESSILPIWGD